ncbi:MAG TPA: glycosyltransferase [Bacteroides reticulotermitis]|nr:glycosyltransferase [Bacteroides reticulotermitis]
MRYSVIIPVYNRPDEVDELLYSLTTQAFEDFEVIIVEDGSSIPCKEVCDRYADRLNVSYYSKPNSGPGQTRNYGAERSQGDYLIILDSDVILPEGYFASIEEELQTSPSDAFGGPDRAHESFTPIQKAINYSMTSFFTTGGIRGGKKKMDKFYPRSFNMGIRREVYQTLGGFSKMRFGEDIDFSIRIFKGGYSCRLFPGAWVYHKRRTDLRKFFKQVHNSGIARINLYKKYPDSLKMVHLLPGIFTLGVVLLTILFGVGLLGGVCALVWMQTAAHRSVTGEAILLMCSLWTMLIALLPLLFYSLLVCVDAGIRNRSFRIGLLSVGASFVQLIGYGAGFWRAWWKRCVLGKDEFEAFRHNFYK